MADQRDGDTPGAPAPPSEPKAPPARQERPGARPSAFGPPRSDPGRKGLAREVQDVPDSQTATLGPLSMKGGFSGPNPYDEPPRSTPQNIFPTLGYDPFRSHDAPLLRAAGPGHAGDDEEGLTPGLGPHPSLRELEEVEVTSPSLVAARSGLLPIPEDEALVPTSAPPPGESSTGPLAISLFAVMLLAALAVLVRQWAVEPAPAQLDVVDAPSAAVPVVQAPSTAEPVAQVDPPEAILARIEGGLPEDEEGAAARLVAYARSFREEGRPEVAELLFRRALERDPGDLSAAVGLTELELSVGRPERARRWAERAVVAAPREASARLLLGDVLARLGESREARRHWREARKLDPKLPGLAERLARRP